MKIKKSKKAPKYNKVSHFDIFLAVILSIPVFVLLAIGLHNKFNGINNQIVNEEAIEAPNVSTPEVNYEISESPVPGYIQDDQGGITEDASIPTMEEVDGGQFEDKDTGVSVTEGQYEDLGWSETYDVSSPEAFKNATLNRCIIANNIFGAQCVSLARVFWWSYADRDVSTCGTGMAKGMMNCYELNAGNDFDVYWSDNVDEIQAGDWLVFNGGQYGHVGMALGPVVNGYVTLLGENQGGHYCEGGGSATNIINLNIKNLIGFYRPKAYIKFVPVAPDTGMPK
jgi:hypothetical protein